MIAHIHHLWLQTQETENQLEIELKNSISLADEKIHTTKMDKTSEASICLQLPP